MLDVDDAAVRASQIRRLEQLKRERDATAVEQALDALTELRAKRAKATCWSAPWMRRASAPRWAKFRRALEKVWGRYQAVTRTISGVYSAGERSDDEFQKAQEMVGRIREGRRPPPAHPGREDGPGWSRSRRQR